MEALLEKSIKMAEKGREDWINLVQEYRIGDKDFVVLFPKVDREINDIAIEYIKKLAEKGTVLVLAHDDVLLKSMQSDNGKTKGIITKFYTRQDSENLMKFYTLYQFTDRLIIVSLDEPEGRTGRGLIGKKGITLKEMIALGIFGMED